MQGTLKPVRWSFYIIYNLPFKLVFKDDQTTLGLFQPGTFCEFKILAYISLQWGWGGRLFKMQEGGNPAWKVRGEKNEEIMPGL